MTHLTNAGPVVLDARAAKLPRKTILAFHELLASGQISVRDFQAILDAAELSRDNQNLITFAASFFAMRLSGVPLCRIITLAKQHRRRLNLSWSPTRWRRELDNLSHLQAIAHFTQENVTYDISAFAQLLPRSFPGYIIPNGRRLAMEGFQQRHCVVDYHDRIKHGLCVMLAIFIAKRRWTVHIELSGRHEAPLQIHDIRARHNRRPTEPITAQIRAMLRIPPP